MRHRMYERILYETYTKLNKGLEYIHDVWGYGCPLGMDPITPEELAYDRRTSIYNDDGSKKINKSFVSRFLYDNKEAYIKHLTSIGQWPMECNKKTMTEERYKYDRNSIFKRYKKTI